MIARTAKMDLTRIAMLATMLSFGLATACRHSPNPSDLETPPMDPQREPVASTDAASASGTPLASLYADIYYDFETGTVRVRYRLRNASTDRGLAVFDRGVYGNWSGVVYAPGPVGPPTVRVDGTDVVLTHAPATPAAPDDLRATPLAVEVAPGGELEGMFLHRIDRSAAFRRLRWCVAIAPFEPDHFRNPHRSAHGTIWMATPDALRSQTLLCSDWHEIQHPKQEG